MRFKDNVGRESLKWSNTPEYALIRFFIIFNNYNINIKYNIMFTTTTLVFYGICGRTDKKLDLRKNH